MIRNMTRSGNMSRKGPNSASIDSIQFQIDGLCNTKASIFIRRKCAWTLFELCSNRKILKNLRSFGLSKTLFNLFQILQVENDEYIRNTLISMCLVLVRTNKGEISAIDNIPHSVFQTLLGTYIRICESIESDPSFSGNKLISIENESSFVTPCELSKPSAVDAIHLKRKLSGQTNKADKGNGKVASPLDIQIAPSIDILNKDNSCSAASKFNTDLHRLFPMLSQLLHFSETSQDSGELYQIDASNDVVHIGASLCLLLINRMMMLLVSESSIENDGSCQEDGNVDDDDDADCGVGYDCEGNDSASCQDEKERSNESDDESDEDENENRNIRYRNRKIRYIAQELLSRIQQSMLSPNSVTNHQLSEFDKGHSSHAHADTNNCCNKSFLAILCERLITSFHAMKTEGGDSMTLDIWLILTLLDVSCFRCPENQVYLESYVSTNIANESTPMLVGVAKFIQQISLKFAENVFHYFTTSHCRNSSLLASNSGERKEMKSLRNLLPELWEASSRTIKICYFHLIVAGLKLLITLTNPSTAEVNSSQPTLVDAATTSSNSFSGSHKSCYLSNYEYLLPVVELLEFCAAWRLHVISKKSSSDENCHQTGMGELLSPTEDPIERALFDIEILTMSLLSNVMCQDPSSGHHQSHHRNDLISLRAYFPRDDISTSDAPSAANTTSTWNRLSISNQSIREESPHGVAANTESTATLNPLCNVLLRILQSETKDFIDIIESTQDKFEADGVAMNAAIVTNSVVRPKSSQSISSVASQPICMEDGNTHSMMITASDSTPDFQDLPIAELVISSHASLLLHCISSSIDKRSALSNNHQEKNQIIKHLPKNSWWLPVRVLKAFVALQGQTGVVMLENVQTILEAIQSMTTGTMAAEQARCANESLTNSLLQSTIKSTPVSLDESWLFESGKGNLGGYSEPSQSQARSPSSSSVVKKSRWQWVGNDYVYVEDDSQNKDEWEPPLVSDDDLAGNSAKANLGYGIEIVNEANSLEVSSIGRRPTFTAAISGHKKEQKKIPNGFDTKFAAPKLNSESAKHKFASTVSGRLPEDLPPVVVPEKQEISKLMQHRDKKSDVIGTGSLDTSRSREITLRALKRSHNPDDKLIPDATDEWYQQPLSGASHDKIIPHAGTLTNEVSRKHSMNSVSATKTMESNNNHGQFHEMLSATSLHPAPKPFNSVGSIPFNRIVPDATRPGNRNTATDLPVPKESMLVPDSKSSLASLNLKTTVKMAEEKKKLLISSQIVDERNANQLPQNTPYTVQSSSVTMPDPVSTPLPVGLSIKRKIHSAPMRLADDTFEKMKEIKPLFRSMQPTTSSSSLTIHKSHSDGNHTHHKGHVAALGDGNLGPLGRLAGAESVSDSSLRSSTIVAGNSHNNGGLSCIGDTGLSNNSNLSRISDYKLVGPNSNSSINSSNQDAFSTKRKRFSY